MVAVSGYTAPHLARRERVREWQRRCWPAQGHLKPQTLFPRSQAAFSDNPPVVFSPQSSHPSPPTPPQQPPASAPQQALQPAVSQVSTSRWIGVH